LLQPHGQSELRTSRRSAHFGYRDRARYRRFLPNQTAAPAASDAPCPLPRHRVNDTGLECELGTPSSRNTAASPPLAVTTRRLACSTAPSAATDGVPERARQHSPTSAIEAKPEHTGERSLPGTPPLFTAERCASRRSGWCETAPTVQVSEPAPCKARKPTLTPELDIPVTDSGPDTLEGDGVLPKSA
jgi:hypothetical protein